MPELFIDLLLLNNLHVYTVYDLFCDLWILMRIFITSTIDYYFANYVTLCDQCNSDQCNCTDHKLWLCGYA